MLRHLVRALGLVWSTSPTYILLIGPLSVVQGLLPVAQLYIVKLLLDLVSKVLQGVSVVDPLRQLLSILALQAVIGLVGLGLSVAQSFFESLLGERLRNDIQRKILVKASTMNLSSFEDSAFYDQMQKAFQEAGSRPIQIISQLQSIVRSVVTIVSFITILYFLSPWILLILIGTSIPSFLIQTRFGNLNYWMLRRRVPELRKQEYYSYILRTDWLIKELKLFNLEGHFLRQFDKLFNTFFLETGRLYKQRAWATFSGSVIASVGSLGALIFVALAVVARTISVGDFSLYSSAVAQFSSRVGSVLGGVSELYNHALFAANLFEFLDLPNSALDKGAQWSEPIHSVEFRHVSFRYPSTDQLVLEDMSFSISSGQTLGIVGPNGAGKTTLIKLLCALYRPTEGKILLNGKDASHYSQRSIQRYVSATFQDFGRYELTATENVKVGDVEAEEDGQRFGRAVSMAGIRDDLEKLPKGYATQLGRWFNEGHQLSGGQWQKVALARAYFRDASVIILDEPTSALDAQSELDVYQTVQHHQKQKMTILISHRFSTMRLADHIIVLQDGKIAEVGSHEQLLAKKGYYKDHFELQAVGYR